MLQAVREDWQRWRLLIYAVMTLTSLGAGTVPLLGTLVAIAAMFLGHLMLFRRPLRWLTPARRVTTRLGIKLWFAFLGVVSLVVNLLAAPLALAGVGALVSALNGLVVFAAYVEGGLWLLERRIAREARSARLSAWEWFLPPALLAGLVVAGLTGAVASWAAVNALASMDVPGIADLARWLLEVE